MKSLLRYTLPVLVLLFGGYALLNLFAGPSGGAMQPGEGPFAESLTLEQAAARSTESGKPVLVFATADWCGPCQRLKRAALADADVITAIRAKTEPVYLDLTDARNDPEAMRHVQQMRIGGIPALILQRNGNEVSRIEGVHTVRSLLAWLETNSRS